MPKLRIVIESDIDDGYVLAVDTEAEAVKRHTLTIVREISNLVFHEDFASVLDGPRLIASLDLEHIFSRRL